MLDILAYKIYKGTSILHKSLCTSYRILSLFKVAHKFLAWENVKNKYLAIIYVNLDFVRVIISRKSRPLGKLDMSSMSSINSMLFFLSSYPIVSVIVWPLWTVVALMWSSYHQHDYLQLYVIWKMRGLFCKAMELWVTSSFAKKILYI